jgi:hypothetical protein
MNPAWPIRGLLVWKSARKNLTFFIFLAVCFQAALLVPYVVLIRDETTNLFTALLGGVSLSICLASAIGSRRPLPAGICVTVAMAVLVLLSGWFSAAPRESLLRGGAMILSGAGGFWGARFLLDDETRQRWFVWFCLGLGVCVVMVAFAGGLINGDVSYLLDGAPHPLVCRLLLLSFAPIFMAFSGDRKLTITGVFVLIAIGMILYLSMRRSAVLIPTLVAAACAMIYSGRFRLLKALVVIVVGGLTLTSLVLYFPDRKLQLTDYEPVSYRAENYPFSWHVAKQHPVLGNGLRAPRDKYLENYVLRSPMGTREAFADSVQLRRTSENVWLTFLADLGMPFTAVYVAAVAVMIVRAIRRRMATRRNHTYLLFDALMFSFACAVVHSFTTDDLLIPEVNWFFHVVLGMICAMVATPSCSVDERLA